VAQNQSTFERGREFQDETFEALECRGAVLDGKELEGCRFVGAQLAGARFDRCKLIDCSFEGCDLSNVALASSILRDVTFVDSKLLGVDWTALQAASHLTFRRCVLNLGNFSGMDLRRCILESCMARELELGHANLAEADCRGSDFAGSVFLHTNLTKCDLRGAVNYAIRPLDNVLKRAKFSMPEATSLLHGLDIVLDD
jgi:uncharacterized protein YjbI with pentapeptide repeats